MIFANTLIIKPVFHLDDRGFFVETYNRSKYTELGIDIEFVQDNHSLSIEAGTLRGIHFQAPPHAQAKLVRCVRGAIYDVVVDLRRKSPTYGQWEGYELTPENGHQLFVPIGFAHGFVTLEPNSEIFYKFSDYYNPKTELSLLWSDNDIGIVWPITDKLILSQKDASATIFADFESPFIYGENS